MTVLRVINAEAASGDSKGCRGCHVDANDAQKAKQDSLLRELASAVRHARENASGANGANGRVCAGSQSPDSGILSREVLSDRVVYHLNPAAPLPFVQNLSHHVMSGRHLWIGVDEGAVAVLNGAEQELMLGLRGGISPAGLIESLPDPVGGTAEVSSLIGRLATAGFLTGVDGYQERRTAQPERFARFHLTKACQLQCIHCYADSSPYEDRVHELPTVRWRRLAEEFAANGGERVLYTGGEALLHKGCVELMSLSKSLGLQVTLFTNGLLVPRFATAIKENVDQVQVSLDGPDEQTNDRIRGAGTFKKITRAMDILLEQGTRVRVGMSVMEQNWSAWKSDFLNLAQRYAHTPLEYRLGFGITHYGRGANLQDELDVNDTQPTVERLLNSVGGGEDGPRITRHTTGCGYCEQFVVGPDGTVYPCHLLDAPVAHVDDRPVAELTRMLKKIAQLFDVDHTEGCRVCDIRYLCGGTCRVMNGEHTGSRLVTTCTQADKDRRYRNLLSLYSTDQAAPA
jgi:radical SAM protein with 4Fe4S-binding SPASM domain